MPPRRPPTRSPWLPTQVPAGTLVVYVPYVMGRDTSIWGADAAEFRPSRWAAGEQTEAMWGYDEAIMARTN